MEDLAEDAKEVIGKEEEDIEAQVVAAPVMTISGKVKEASVVTKADMEVVLEVSKADMEVNRVDLEEVMEALNSSKEVQVTEGKEDSVVNTVQEVTGDLI